MNPKDTSGPAFPVSDLQGASPRTMDDLIAMARGMSRRDYFAAEAMKVLLANALLECDPGKRGDAILESVESSFFIADLMVKESQK